MKKRFSEEQIDLSNKRGQVILTIFNSEFLLNTKRRMSD